MNFVYFLAGVVCVSFYGASAVMRYNMETLDGTSILDILNTHAAEIAALKNTVTAQNQHIKKQSSEIKHLKQRLVQQERHVDIHEQELDRLKNKWINSKDITNVADQVDTNIHSGSDDSYSDYMTSPANRNKRLLLMNQEPGLSTNSMHPAFTAKLKAHVYGLGNNQPVVFDDVITNINNAYSNLTGVFTSPTNGIFYFFASIFSHITKYIETEIVLNGVSTVKTYSYDSQLFNQGSNSVVLSLKAGDKVWVRHLNQEGQDIYGDSFTSFSEFQFCN